MPPVGVERNVTKRDPAAAALATCTSAKRRLSSAATAAAVADATGPVHGRRDEARRMDIGERTFPRATRKSWFSLFRGQRLHRTVPIFNCSRVTGVEKGWALAAQELEQAPGVAEQVRCGVVPELHL